MRPELLGGVAINRRVPHPKSKRRDFLRVRRAHIDIQLMHFRHFFLPFLFSQMNGGVADQPAHRAFSPRICSRRPRAVAVSEPPTRSMRRNPSLVIVLDDVANLVRVRFEHDALWNRRASRVAQAVP